MLAWSDRILHGKKVLITGASSGIGKACAVLCSQLGAQIIALGRDVDRLAETMAKIAGSGHISIACDLSDSEQLSEKLSIIKSSAPISGFVHSAGIERTSPLKSIEPISYCEMFHINVVSAVQIAGILAAQKMYDKNGCSYVFISSIRGEYGGKGLIEYSSTKSAIYGAVKSMAKELAGKEIRVNSISPAMVDTPMLRSLIASLPEESVHSIRDRHLMGILEPMDVANLCAYLISDMGKHITGSNITIDSGYTLF